MNNYIAGLQTAFDDAEAEIDQMAMQTLIQTYFQELQMRQFEERAAQAEVNAEQGRAFLEENLQNRSEEHTSELHSRGHLVCRLLLEKKKTTTANTHTTTE